MIDRYIDSGGGGRWGSNYKYYIRHHKGGHYHRAITWTPKCKLNIPSMVGRNLKNISYKCHMSYVIGVWSKWSYEKWVEAEDS